MRAALLGSLLLLVACNSAGGSGEDPAGAAGGAGGSGQGGGAGGSAGGGGSSGSAGTGGGVQIGGMDGGGGATLCQAKETPGKRIPASVLIVLDRSGSMKDAGKWPAASSALNAMLGKADPELAMGISRFPEGTPAPCGLDIACQTNFECTDIKDIPNVPVAPLKESKGAIQDLISVTGPNGGTPTLWALKKAYKYMAELQTDGERFVLLVTDGEPTLHTPALPPLLPEMGKDCGEEIDLAKAPTDARKGNPSVRTFVIGAPGSEGGQVILSGIAQNGGTCRPGGSPGNNTCHYQIGSSNFEQDLASTLTEIAGSVSNCSYAVPVPSGEEVDPDKVNVIVTTAEGDKTVYKDTNHEDGWDYTDESKSKIQIFGPQCEAINQGTEASVKIGLGCQTVVK